MNQFQTWINETPIQSSGQKGCLCFSFLCDGIQASFLPLSHLCAGGQIPLAKSNIAGNCSGRETISNVGSAGATEQWLCDIPSRTQCASHNWKAFVIWLPFDYDVQDGNPNRTGVMASEGHAHIAFPGFTSHFKRARLLISRGQYLSVPSLLPLPGRGGSCRFVFALYPLLCPIVPLTASSDLPRRYSKQPEGYKQQYPQVSGLQIHK